MKNKDIFTNTRFPRIARALEQSFPDRNPASVYRNACSILQRELAGVNDRGNKAVGGHIRQNILPGYACYKALLEAGVKSEAAVAFVEREVCKSAQSVGTMCGRLSTKPYAYPLFKVLFGLGMKLGYPQEGWKIEPIENGKERLRFHIKSCLYCEELEKRGALELCRAFCQSDHTTYDPLSPAVVFKRESTIAEGSKQCDFCFERGKIR